MPARARRVVDRRAGYGSHMSAEDKIKNKLEELGGEGKEALGRATDDPELGAEGRADQTRGSLKQAGEKIKDMFRPRRPRY